MLLELATATPMGADDFIGSIAKGYSPCLMVLALEGNLRSSGSDGGGTTGHCFGVGYNLGTRGGRLVRVVAETARGRRGQFGNDDAPSRVWVVARTLIVDNPVCPMGSLVTRV
jgi:hypothetical protein